MENNNINLLGNKKTFITFLVLSSLLGIIFFIATLLQKPPLPNEVAATFATNQNSFVLFAVLSLLWSVFTIPAIIAIVLLHKKNNNTGKSLAAISLTSAGVLLNGIVSFIYVGALISIWNTKQISGANVEYDMAFWTNLFYFMTDPALLIWGLGQLFLGGILLSNPNVSKIISVLTIIGGLAGMLTLVVFQTPILAILQELTLIILTTYFSFYLLRSKKS